MTLSTQPSQGVDLGKRDYSSLTQFLNFKNSISDLDTSSPSQDILFLISNPLSLGSLDKKCQNKEQI